MYKPLVILLFPLVFFACQSKDTGFIKKIHNQSSKPIHFYFYGNYNPVSFGDSVLVAAGELKEILYYSESGSSVGTQQACRVYNDSIRVVVIGGGVLQKRLQEEVGWSYRLDNYNQICTFEITDADIL